MIGWVWAMFLIFMGIAVFGSISWKIHTLLGGKEKAPSTVEVFKGCFGLFLLVVLGGVLYEGSLGLETKPGDYSEKSNFIAVFYFIIAFFILKVTRIWDYFKIK